MTSPRAELRFVFLMCNDINAIQGFYGNQLGLETDGSAEQGFLEVAAGTRLIFFKGDYDLPIIKDWAWQPGYQGGTGNLTSFSLHLNLEDFRAAYNRLKEAGTPLLHGEPVWRKDAYWGLTTQDPMGNTWEIYSVPETKPDILTWR